MKRIRKGQTPVSEVVAAFVETIRSAAAETLKLTGRAPRPAMHMFVDDPEQPYVGYIETRDFYRGEDAARAISALGYPASTLPASRLLMVWEHSDMLTGLGLPQPVRENALVFLEATLDDHRIDWAPFTASLDPHNRVDLSWGEPRTLHRPTLPAPIAEALGIWRRLIPEDFKATVALLEQNGYEFTSVTRLLAEPPP